MMKSVQNHIGYNLSYSIMRVRTIKISHHIFSMTNTKINSIKTNSITETKRQWQ